MKIAILGYGIQGRSALNYWSVDGNEITVCDRKEDLDIPKGIDRQLGKDYLAGLDQFDLIVRSPNIHPKAIVAANHPDILGRVTTPTNEFLEVCPTKNVIGVTGTKGKGTTSSLITKILEADGKKTYLGGNFGISPLDLLKENIQEDDWVVLELANFQLIDLKKSPHIAVCLMVAPEHLDWHETMDEYVFSKKQLFINQTSKDIAIYYAKNEQSREVAGASPGIKIPFYEEPGAVVENGEFVIEGQTVCRTDQLLLLGEHNWQNVCAAVTVCFQVTNNIAAIRKAVTSFEPLENRLELVRELDGVKYYNDSFGSAPDATVAAVKAFKQNKIVIVGGFDRMLPLGELVETVKHHEEDIKEVLLIGSSIERLSRELESAGFSKFKAIHSKDIQKIVEKAKSAAGPGDVVVFSPGFPSFDMFKNFEERGQMFKQAVNSL